MQKSKLLTSERPPVLLLHSSTRSLPQTVENS